jgi:hypothetical protein
MVPTVAETSPYNTGATGVSSEQASASLLERIQKASASLLTHICRSAHNPRPHQQSRGCPIPAFHGYAHAACLLVRAMIKFVSRTRGCNGQGNRRGKKAVPSKYREIVAFCIPITFADSRPRPAGFLALIRANPQRPCSLNSRGVPCSPAPRPTTRIPSERNRRPEKDRMELTSNSARMHISVAILIGGPRPEP